MYDYLNKNKDKRTRDPKIQSRQMNIVEKLIIFVVYNINWKSKSRLVNCQVAIDHADA